MKSNNNDPVSQQFDTKLTQELMQNNSDSQLDKMNRNIEDTEEALAETTFQRRPQFRFNENDRRRFF